MTKNNNDLLGINVEFRTRKYNLEKILLFLHTPNSFFHIVSINPENVVVAYHDKHFSNVLSQGDIQLADGVGITIGGFVLGISVPERSPGVDFMNDVLKMCKSSSLRVLFLGGKGDLAEKMADRYSSEYPSSTFKGHFGFSKISDPNGAEEDKIFAIVADYKPQILFIAYGSPYQELWLDKNKGRLKGIICMGVGGGFDFQTGNVKRAPALIRALGFEWFFRLVIEPWRWKRQLRLFEYIFLVFKQRFGLLKS